MPASTDLTFDRLLELLAEKLANKLSQVPNSLVPRLLSVEQAAIYLGQTTEATQHLANAGKIPAVRVDRRIFLDRFDVDKWIDENKTGWM
jgi:excisionase family DNA binding protein